MRGTDGRVHRLAEFASSRFLVVVFIFDQQRRLRFEGRIDDHLRESRAKTQGARGALDALPACKPVSVGHTPVFGCGTKWNSHAEGAAAEMREHPALLET